MSKIHMEKFYDAAKNIVLDPSEKIEFLYGHWINSYSEWEFSKSDIPNTLKMQDSAYLTVSP